MIIRLLLALSINILLVNSALSYSNCYEKEISYPKEMFGQFSGKQKTSIKKINKFFKHGKYILPEKPYRMLYGLAYLEILVNELCTDVSSYSGIKARKKIEEVFDEIQRSNMSKLGENGEPIYREDGKVMKGPNYFKPNIADILKR